MVVFEMAFIKLGSKDTLLWNAYYSSEKVFQYIMLGPCFANKFPSLQILVLFLILLCLIIVSLRLYSRVSQYSKAGMQDLLLSNSQKEYNISTTFDLFLYCKYFYFVIINLKIWNSAHDRIKNSNNIFRNKGSSC